MTENESFLVRCCSLALLCSFRASFFDDSWSTLLMHINLRVLWSWRKARSAEGTLRVLSQLQLASEAHLQAQILNSFPFAASLKLVILTVLLRFMFFWVFCIYHDTNESSVMSAYVKLPVWKISSKVLQWCERPFRDLWDSRFFFRCCRFQFMLDEQVVFHNIFICRQNDFWHPLWSTKHQTTNRLSSFY